MDTRPTAAVPISGPGSKSSQVQQITSVEANPGANSVSTVERDLALSANTSKEELHVKPELSATDRSTQEFHSKQGLMATTTGSASAVAESPRISKMVKSGLNFVIPKNKLLGAMVPINKSATKWEPLDPKKEELKPPARKTKWGPDMTQDAVVKKGRALALQTRAEQLAAQLESGNLDIDSNEDTRSPSPPPLYDTLGHRMNTREGRKREQLDLERREAIGECMRLNPAYKPPSGYKPVAKEAKLYIPVKENPGYNFIGLILGPRGNTQKRMEAETGAKITIRGKGAVKEGKMQSARNGKDVDGASEELHVDISADTYEKVDAAVALIEPLLTPVDEDRNMHKMKQLRELAEMNGTLNDFSRVCGVCGEAGHREWQCPKEKLQNFQANVMCQICGDGGHPTIDCPQKKSGQGVTFDKEYLNFLEELGTGLEGVGTSIVADQPSGPNTSQPMLLTTLGAQPVPSRWMTPHPSGMSAPRGPPDGPPPISQGMNTFTPFVPRFFQSGGVPSGPIREQPFPGPSMPMMGRMLPPFRGQSPGPPAGSASSMGPPALPITNTGMPPPSANSQMPGQFVPMVEVRFSGNHSLPRGAQAVSSTQDDASNVPILTMSSATSSFPLSGPLPTVSPIATSVQSFPSTSASNLSPMETARPVLPSASVHAVTSSTPSPAVMPLIRPVVPSIRPALTAPNAQHGLTSATGGLGQTLSNSIPPIGGAGNVVPHANNSFTRPPPPLSSSAIPWGGRGPSYPGAHPRQVTPSFDRPPLAAMAPVPQPPVSFNNQLLQSPMRGSSPMPMPMAAPVQGHTIRGPPNLSTQLPPQGQFGMSANNQLASQSSSHASPRPVFPPLLGSQTRAANLVSVTPSGGVSSLPASIQPTGMAQPNAFRPSQELPRPPVMHNMQFSPQGHVFPHRAEFLPPRPPQPMGAQARPEFRNPGVQQQGTLVSSSILGNPAMNRPLVGPPQEALNRGYSPNFLPGPARNPSPNFTGVMGAGNPPWDPQRDRPNLQQTSGRPPVMATSGGWNPDPHVRPQPVLAVRPQMQDVDPEYENLMASVGVL